MSGSARKRNSKWETKEDSQFLHRGKQENDWHQSRITSIPDNRSRVWHAPEATGVYHTHWPSMGRGSQRDDNIVEHRGRTLDTMTRWEGEERYGSQVSPDLDDLRMQNRYHTPKNGWRRQRRSKSRSRSRSQSQPRSSRRSRSRSPVHSFRRDSGDHDRSRGGLGSSSQLCRNFSAGRCKRGDRCLFVHQDPQNYKDRFEGREKHVRSMRSDHHVSREYPGWGPRSTQWCEDFLKGSCRRGTTCRFSHRSDPNASGMVMKNVAVRERNDSSTDLSLERPGECETHSAFDVPCKFFAAGRCRNGKHCRFSHQDQAHASPDKRSPDGRWPLSHSENGSENLLNGPMCSDLDTSYDNHNISDDKYVKVSVPDQVTGWSMDGTCGKSLDDNRCQSVPVVDQKAVEIDRMESLQSMTDHHGDSFRVCEQGSSKSQIEDVEMSPEWNYRLSLPNHNDKGLNSMHGSETNNYTEIPGIVIPTAFKGLSSVQQNNIREVCATDLPSGDKAFAGKIADLCDISANLLGGEGSNETGLVSNPLSLPCLNVFGQSQVAVNTESSRALGIGNSLIQTPSWEGKEVNVLDEGNAHAFQVSSGIPKAQNLASSEQLSQLSDLEASLVQFIANASGQKLSQFYAANGPHNGKEIPALAQRDGSVQPVSAVGIREIVADGKPEAPPKNLSLSVTLSPSNGNGGEGNKFNTSGKEPSDENYRLSKLEMGLNLELPNASFHVGTNESRKTEETVEDHGLLETNDGRLAGDDKTHRYRQVKVERRKAQVNDSLENPGENKNADKSKESKDNKVLRPFKFALAEFVKELLKPKWKEGQMSKDSYKIIVKKVVDKVTVTLHGANIPHTQQKIEQYLSVSKPKLAKLVQAYVEKFQKEK